MSDDLSTNEDFLKSAFKGYDINGDGRVTVKEFKRIMSRQGKLSHKDIENMISKADIDSDGSIDFKEFKKMMAD